MRALVNGYRVAVVGRAGSLWGSGNGPAIDAADVVIRINWVLPIPPEDVADIGARTDLVYHCKRARTAKRTAKKMGVSAKRVSGKYRTSVARNLFKKPKRFRPTTGFMAIVESLESGAAEIGCYGMDFFTSGHVQERMPGTDNYAKPLGWAHSPEEERKALRKLVAMNSGVIKPDRILTEALK